MSTREIEITNRSKLGWSYRAWTPNDPEPPSAPEYVGTYKTICRAIANDRTYVSYRSGGTYHSTAWFVRVSGRWARVVCANYNYWRDEMEYYKKAVVTVEF